MMMAMACAAPMTAIRAAPKAAMRMSAPAPAATAAGSGAIGFKTGGGWGRCAQALWLVAVRLQPVLGFALEPLLPSRYTAYSSLLPCSRLPWHSSSGSLLPIPLSSCPQIPPGGDQDVANFRENVAAGKLPLPSDV